MKETSHQRQTDTDRQTDRETAGDTYTDVDELENPSVGEYMQSVACDRVDHEQSMYLAIGQLEDGFK